MPYYAAGDYYRGDYYRGDIFDVVKKGFSIAKGAVGGFLKGGPVGAVKGGLSAAVSRNVPQPPGPMISPKSMALVAQQGIPVPAGTPGATKTPGISGTLQRFLPGGASGYEVMGAPSGYHWNKSFSYAKGLPPGSFLVRNRRMNPLNPTALRRTVRRQRGAVGLMRAVLSGSGYTIKRSGLPGKGRKRSRR